MCFDKIVEILLIFGKREGNTCQPEIEGLDAPSASQSVTVCLWCDSPSGMGCGLGWSSDLGISSVGEILSRRGKGDSLLLETLAAVLPSRELASMVLGLLHSGRPGLIMPLGQLPKDTPSSEPHDFIWGGGTIWNMYSTKKCVLKNECALDL